MMGLGNISATIENSDAIKQMIEKKLGNLRSILDPATQEAGEIIRDEMRYRAPHHTGENLSPDITVEREATGGLSSTVSVGPRKFPGARQREYGGWIYAKNAPRLVWQDYDGNWHSAEKVYQNPTPYVRPAIVAKRGEAAAHLASKVREAFGL